MHLPLDSVTSLKSEELQVKQFVFPAVEQVKQDEWQALIKLIELLIPAQI